METRFFKVVYHVTPAGRSYPASPLTFTRESAETFASLIRAEQPKWLVVVVPAWQPA